MNNEPKNNTPLDAAKVEHNKEVDEQTGREAEKFTDRIEQNKAAAAASPSALSR